MQRGDIILEEKKKKSGKLATYAIIMLLTAIIVIIIAAMADNREESFQNQIEETTQANTTIQEEVVRLKNENYDLKNQLEKLQQEKDKLSASDSLCTKLSDICKLYLAGNTDEAKNEFEGIDEASVPDNLKDLYSSIKSLTDASAADSQADKK